MVWLSFVGSLSGLGGSLLDQGVGLTSFNWASLFL